MKRIHTLAVIVIAACIVVGGYNMDRALTRNAMDAQTINIAGAQRMLSQRIAALTLLYHRADPESSERYFKALKGAHARMLEGHQYLTQATGQSLAPAQSTQKLATLYSPTGRDLDRRVRRFLESTQAFLGVEQADLRAVPMPNFTDLDFLLADLDKAVSLYEANAKAKILAAERLLKQTILLALIVLFLVAVFVFRPMAKQASGALEESESELKKRSDLLSRAFDIAGMGYWLNRTDRPNELWISEELARLYKTNPVGQWLTLDQVKSLVQDQNNELLSKAARVSRATGTPQYVETRLRRGDGSFIEISTSIAAELDETGEVELITGVVRDITADVEARRAVEERSNDLKEAQELGNTAVWRFPIGARSLELNEDAYRLMRYDFSKMSDYKESADERTDKGTHLSRMCLGDSFEDLKRMSAQVFKTGQSGEVTIMMRRGDGTVADLSVRIKLQRDDEGKPIGFFGTMQDVSEQKEAERQLEQLAYYDHLTGLSNRALCMRQLKKLCNNQPGDGQDAALVLIDLDNFKEINDGLGHQAGDEFLCEIGRRLSHLAGPKNLVARLGGDEFALIIRDARSVDRVTSLVSSMLAAVAAPLQLDSAELVGGASAGICFIPSDTTSASEALRFADLALYDAKERGRNRFAFFNSDMSDRLQSRLSLSRDLRLAIANDELETHFQPIVSGKDGRVIGFETLMRWQHAERGWISPSEFIPIAESSHLIGDIGQFALKDACQHAVAMSEVTGEPIEVAVNVSAAQLWHGDVEQMIANALSASGVDPSLLCIELTESVFVGDSMDRVAAFLRRLKARGVQLALDDFGTGYSSLGYLNSLPFDKLKIDRSFVAGVDVSQKRFQVLEGVVGLARGLGMKVVAEGVETAAELAAIQSLDCDFVQGFFFGRPEGQSQALAAIERINGQAQDNAAAHLRQQVEQLEAVSRTALKGKTAAAS
ncbi:MAG: EAL domain-containing protein [Pseudomonadota bacterium]